MWRRSGVAALVALLTACGPEGVVVDPSEAITPIALAEARVEGPDGDAAPLALRRERPYLLHFWATWCAPCREELPSLLEAGAEAGGEGAVVAVSLDGAWAPVRGFFEGGVPPAVVREPAGGLARQLGVVTLPDTYLVDAAGVATRRVRGARDWSVEGHRRWLRAALAGPRAEDPR